MMNAMPKMLLISVTEQFSVVLESMSSGLKRAAAMIRKGTNLATEAATEEIMVDDDDHQVAHRAEGEAAAGAEAKAPPLEEEERIGRHIIHVVTGAEVPTAAGGAKVRVLLGTEALGGRA